MFCVIQQVEIKKVNRGEAKRIEVYESSFSINGENCTYYKYRYSDERFERPVKKAFKISIHESYREQRKVKKRQTVICTVGYSISSDKVQAFFVTDILKIMVEFCILNFWRAYAIMLVGKKI